MVIDNSVIKVSSDESYAKLLYNLYFTIPRAQNTTQTQTHTRTRARARTHLPIPSLMIRVSANEERREQERRRVKRAVLELTITSRYPPNDRLKAFIPTTHYQEIVLALALTFKTKIVLYFLLPSE